MSDRIDLVCPFCSTSLTGVYWAWSDMRRGHCLKHGDIEAIALRVPAGSRDSS